MKKIDNIVCKKFDVDEKFDNIVCKFWCFCFLLIVSILRLSIFKCWWQVWVIVIFWSHTVQVRYSSAALFSHLKTLRERSVGVVSIVMVANITCSADELESFSSTLLSVFSRNRGDNRCHILPSSSSLHIDHTPILPGLSSHYSRHSTSYCLMECSMSLLNKIGECTSSRRHSQYSCELLACAPAWSCLLEIWVKLDRLS